MVGRRGALLVLSVACHTLTLGPAHETAHSTEHTADSRDERVTARVASQRVLTLSATRSPAVSVSLHTVGGLSSSSSSLTEALRGSPHTVQIAPQSHTTTRAADSSRRQQTVHRREARHSSRSYGDTYLIASVIPRSDASPKAIARPTDRAVPLRGTASERGISTICQLLWRDAYVSPNSSTLRRDAAAKLQRGGGGARGGDVSVLYLVNEPDVGRYGIGQVLCVQRWGWERWRSRAPPEGRYDVE